MAVEFGAVIDNAFNKMKEYEFLRMSQEDAESVLRAYIRPACTAYADKRGFELEVDNEVGVFKQDLSETDIDILGSYVCIKYIDANYIRTTLSLKPFLSGTDFHSYTNKEVLKQAMEAQKVFKEEVDGSNVLRSYRDKNSRLWNLHKNRGRYP